MCDYSINRADRAAEKGERLVLRRFGWITKGFTSPDKPEVAVCLAPGTSVVVTHVPPGLLNQRFAPGVKATFVQREPHPPESLYRDSLQLDGEDPVLLQVFPEEFTIEVGEK